MKKIIIILALLFATTQITNGYEFNGKDYKISYPENIEYLEYCYISNQCEVPGQFDKLIYLNLLLIKNGYKSIW